MKRLLLVALILIPFPSLAQDVDINSAVRVTAGGSIGLGTSAPTARLDFNNLTTAPNTAETVFRFRTKEANAGDFSLQYGSFLNDYGQTRRDNGMSIGYNVGCALSTEPCFQWSLESLYRTAEGTDQTEFYFAAGTPGHPTTRPFSIDLYHASGFTQVGFTTNSVKFWDGTGQHHWLRLASGPTTGDLTLLGNSGIRYEGSRPWILTSASGIPLIGSPSASVATIFGGVGNGSDEVNFFGNINLGGTSPAVTLTVGTRGVDAPALRYASARWQLSNGGGVYGEIFSALNSSNLNAPNFAVVRDANGDFATRRVALEQIDVGGAAPQITFHNGAAYIQKGGGYLHLIDNTSLGIAINYGFAGIETGPLLYFGGNTSPRWKVDKDNMYLWDGTSLKPVSIGPPDSCGTGYKCLRIAN